MAVQLFAAIDIGSFDLELSIYEVNSKGKIRRLDSVNNNMALGEDTYENGIISYESLNKLCGCLNQFKQIIMSYAIDLKNVYVFGTSAMREAKNRIVVEDQIKVRCGMEVKILSNSEQRFVSYKAIPRLLPDFSEIITRESAIVDVGYGSMQISLYDRKELKSTHNIKLGALRIQALLEKMSGTNQDYKLITEEIVDNEIESFTGYYLKGKKLKNIIAVGDCMRVFASKILGFKEYGEIPAEDYRKIYAIISTMNIKELAAAYDLPTGFSKLVLPIAMIYDRMFEATGAEVLYIPGCSLSDGVAVEWAERKKLTRSEHDFTQDIISSAREINKRYYANVTHTLVTEKFCDAIFEATKKIHGMGKREKLLLQLAAILHDVGKYINMTAPGRCGYDIIMATEILGISHEERGIVANVVKYNTFMLETYNMDGAWSKEKYMIIYKLTAILRLANILDRSHKQKMSDYTMTVKDDKLIINISTDENIALERGMLEERSLFFEEAFGLIPELHVRKRR